MAAGSRITVTPGRSCATPRRTPLKGRAAEAAYTALLRDNGVAA
ncbi:hypothetical protein [Streptomyces sp. R02]|uniref:Uncharacterized protein n=1 Tax=Streptomyces sp. R02 TaxID=3238623 RepID=A0AB39LKF9_9ACTN